MNDFRQFPCKERRNGVSHLLVLLGTGTYKEVVVRKGLKPRGLPHSEAPALQGIRMDEVVTVFRDMRRHRSRRPLLYLYAETVGEREVIIIFGFPRILVVGQKTVWKIRQ